MNYGSDTHRVDYGCMFEAVIQEDSHIRQPFFLVTIPSLFPEVENKLDASLDTFDIDSHRVKNSNFQGGSFSSTTIIKARNFTDYAYQYKGDIFKDRYEEVDGITEPSEDPSPDGSSDDIIAHEHDIKKAISIFNHYFENLNNVTVPKTTKCYGFFLNGTFDTRNFVITRIENAIPLQRNTRINYVK